ncbi:hypothetical protein MBANPS3_006674 [Mucor bainieri]
MANIRNFANQIQQAYTTQDEGLFSRLITIDVSSPTVNTLAQDLQHTSEDQVQNTINGILEDTSYALAEATNNYMEVVRYLTSTDIDFVFETFANFYRSLIPVFNGSDTFFMVPVIKSLSTSLVQLAFRVDKMGLQGKARKANLAARLVSKVFNIMLADRSPMETSKRQGIFHITNLAFKVYFKLDSVRMCQTFISNINTGGLELDMFPISQQVTYKYYIGRYALYHGRLQHAQDCLMFAFEKCHAHQWHNKRLILHYLIPTRIILGHFPSIQLLEKYQLAPPYVNLINTIRSGNIHGFLHHLETYFDYFYHRLTYLLLKERGLVLVWRCLLKNAYALQQRIGIVTAPKLRFETMLRIFDLSSQGEEVYEYDDLECIVVSLVSQGYIRGYIHHQHQHVVFSKTTPFPPICNVTAHVERYNEATIEEHLNQTQQPLPPQIKELME